MTQVPEARFTYDYQRPALGVDVAVFSLDTFGKLWVANIVRGKEPFVGLKALPGGHIDPGDDGFGEPVLDAAVREPREETSLELTKEQLTFVDFYDEPHRDPRGWRVTFLYYTLLEEIQQLQFGDDAKDAFWTNLNDTRLIESDWSFDHAKLIWHAWQRLYADHGQETIPKPSEPSWRKT